MSVLKDKLVASAQKFIQKGQMDRAVRDYEKLVELDPKDIKNRQKLAELLVRCNRLDDALKEFEAIGTYYSEHGFFLKAIAVYKQIQKIEPMNPSRAITLASLNEKQGLLGNALAEYKIAVDYYERAGIYSDAMAIIEKMLALDAQNVNIQLKLADLCCSAGQQERGYGLYTAAALALRTKGDDEALRRVCEQVKSRFPENQQFVTDLLGAQVRGGDGLGALPTLRSMLATDSDNTQLLSLLAEACRQTGALAERDEVCRRLLALTPADLPAQSCLIQWSLDTGAVEQSIELLERFTPSFLAAGATAELETHYTILREQTPGDTRVREGLLRVYDASRQQSVAADPLDLKDAYAPEPLPVDNLFPLEDELLENEGESAAMAGTITELMPWDESLDLTLERGEAETLTHQLAQEAAGLDSGLLDLEQMEPFSLDLDLPDTVTDFNVPDDSPSDLQNDTDHGEIPMTDQQIDFSQTDDEFVLEIELDETGGDAYSDLNIPEWQEPDSSFSQQADDPSVFPWPDEVIVQGDEQLPHGKYSIDGVFSAFKRGLNEHVDKEDTETHYNLGIAYREMGLLDDAIAEFKAASATPERLLDCVVLAGSCYLDKGDLVRAEQLIRAGLNIANLSEAGSLSLSYELGRIQVASGQNSAALETFHRIFAVNPAFRDTAVRIARLAGGEAGLDNSDLELLDFTLEQPE